LPSAFYYKAKNTPKTPPAYQKIAAEELIKQAWSEKPGSEADLGKVRIKATGGKDITIHQFISASYDDLFSIYESLDLDQVRIWTLSALIHKY